MNRLIPILILLLLYSSVEAQREDELKGLIYQKELSFGLRVPMQGWTIFSDIGRFMTVNQRRVIQIEFAEVKFSKEYKEVGQVQPRIGWPSPKPYFFGKQNNFYALRFAYGRRKLIAQKAEKSAVELRLTYLGGVSIGLLKPYYLFIEKERGVTPVTEKYDDSNASDFLNIAKIYGGAGFAHGLGEIGIRPGLHGKLGLNFDWAVYDEFIKAIEVGLSVDIYPKEIPIMIVENNSQIFASLYFSFQFGRRW